MLPGAMNRDEHEARVAAWHIALEEGCVPEFVAERLGQVGGGKAPWVSTMTPAELLLARTHGVRAIATVSGNCWMKISFGAQWFGLCQGHAEGWQSALARVEQEAIAAGANAVVDLRLTHKVHGGGKGTEFGAVGTAVRIEGLAPSAAPVLAAVPAIEFVRLMAADVVPTGVAVGASSDLLGSYNSGFGNGGYTSSWNQSYNTSFQVQVQASSWTSQPIPVLTDFWERIRRQAISDLERATQGRGNGVLAHSHQSRLVRIERDKQPPMWMGEHIVLGTIVDVADGAKTDFDMIPVIDLGSDSVLTRASGGADNIYPGDEKGVTYG
jgi:uncharacterized protein YbjQ (UPF0145 family)